METVQFFQFDSEGNMYMFEPGAGCTGVPKFVPPGEEMIFSGHSDGKLEASSNTWTQEVVVKPELAQRVSTTSKRKF